MASKLQQLLCAFLYFLFIYFSSRAYLTRVSWSGRPKQQEVRAVLFRLLPSHFLCIFVYFCWVLSHSLFLSLPVSLSFSRLLSLPNPPPYPFLQSIASGLEHEFLFFFCSCILLIHACGETMLTTGQGVKKNAVAVACYFVLPLPFLHPHPSNRYNVFFCICLHFFTCIYAINWADWRTSEKKRQGQTKTWVVWWERKSRKGR